MSNTQETYWEASGVSLHTEAWSLRTWGGGRNATAPKRGDNDVVPFAAGRRHRRKVRDGRIMPLSMWMLPFDANGNRAPGVSMEEQKEANWRILQAAFDTDGQFPLTKRWRQDGTIMVATALAELIDEMTPTVTGGHRVEFTPTLELADPWFYGAEVSQPIGTIDVLGDKPTEHVTLTMTAGRVTTPDGNWIEYTGAGTVVVDCYAKTAKVGPTWVNGLIVRNPEFPEWLRLTPGSNALTGAGTIAYAPAYL